MLHKNSGGGEGTHALQAESWPTAITDSALPYVGKLLMTAGSVKIVFTDDSCDVEVLVTWVSNITEPLRTPTTLRMLAGSFSSACSLAWKSAVLAAVHVDKE